MYEFVKTVEVAEVIKHFLYMEAYRKKYLSLRSELLSWRTLSDNEIIEKSRDFANLRDDENPVLVWTVGTQKNKHHLKIDRWKLGIINLNFLYSRGINPSMEQDLASVKGNISDFARTYSKKYDEFQSDELPNGEYRILIALARTSTKYNGNLELIDGAHRAISMLKNQINQSHAYIGVLKDNQDL